MTMFSSMNNKGMILYKGFDHRNFDYLLCKFQPYYDRYIPYMQDKEQTYFNIVPVSLMRGIKMGQTRFLDAKMCLGMVLCWKQNTWLFMLQICSIWIC